MKKSKDYAPYLYAFLITVIAVATQNLFLKSGILFRSTVYFFLQTMVRLDDPQTEGYILKLAEVYRQTLNKEKNVVTLQEELDFFNAYMYLMTLRQEEGIFVEVQVSDESLVYRLPAFSLQLLAENCIKHNIVSEAKPLTIRLYQKDPKSLTISNNYQPKAMKSESFNIGIKNLKKRYALEGIIQGVQIEKNETIYSTTIKLF